MKKIRALFFILLSCILLFYCSDNEQSSQNQEIQPVYDTIQIDKERLVNLEDFFLYPYADDNILTPKLSVEDLDTLFSEFGEPDEIIKQKVINRHDNNIIDYQYTIIYDHFSVYYYYASTREIYFRILYIISSNKYNFNYGIKIGMNYDDLINIFGEPDSRYDFENNYEIVYGIDFSYYSIHFSIVNNKLSDIILGSMVD